MKNEEITAFTDVTRKVTINGVEQNIVKNGLFSKRYDNLASEDLDRIHQHRKTILNSWLQMVKRKRKLNSHITKWDSSHSYPKKLGKIFDDS